MINDRGKVLQNMPGNFLGFRNGFDRFDSQLSITIVSPVYKRPILKCVDVCENTFFFHPLSKRKFKRAIEHAEKTNSMIVNMNGRLSTLQFFNNHLFYSRLGV